MKVLITANCILLNCIFFCLPPSLLKRYCQKLVSFFTTKYSFAIPPFFLCFVSVFDVVGFGELFIWNRCANELAGGRWWCICVHLPISQGRISLQKPTDLAEATTRQTDNGKTNFTIGHRTGNVSIYFFFFVDSSPALCYFLSSSVD